MISEICFQNEHSHFWFRQIGIFMVNSCSIISSIGWCLLSVIVISYKQVIEGNFLFLNEVIDFKIPKKNIKIKTATIENLGQC